MKNVIFIFIMLITKVFVQSQNYNSEIKRTMHWYFGKDAGLNFTNLPPVVDTNANNVLALTLFSISDTCGNLLFYGGEDKSNPSRFIVLSRNHQLMENGVLLPCCVKDVLVVPQPGNDSIYYIFYTDVYGVAAGKLTYAIINIKKNNGLGKVESNYQEVLLQPNVRWNIAAAHHCNGKDIWIITKRADDDPWDGINIGDSYFAWLLNENGLNNIPVISQVVVIPEWQGAGKIRFSPDGSKVVSFFFYGDRQKPDSSWIELYKFDRCTGMLYDPIMIGPLPAPSGICFSPNSSKLYIFSDFVITYWHHGEEIFAQYDVSDWNQSSIINSRVIIEDGPVSGNFQIGIDGKIYVMRTYYSDTINYDFDNIGIIYNPDESGLLCNYLPYQINLLGRYHCDYSPPFIDTYFSNFNYYDCNSGTSENNLFSTIKIYPNPVNDILKIKNLQVDNKLNIKIYNVVNKLICESILNSSLEEKIIDTKDLPQGIYLIYVYSDNKLLTINKFIKL